MPRPDIDKNTEPARSLQLVLTRYDCGLPCVATIDPARHRKFEPNTMKIEVCNLVGLHREAASASHTHPWRAGLALASLCLFGNIVHAEGYRLKTSIRVDELGGGPTAINNRGQVVGQAGLDNSMRYGVLWDGRHLRELANLDNAYAPPQVNTINDAGLMGGFSASPLFDVGNRATLWPSNREPQNLAESSGVLRSAVQDVNNTGMGVGNQFVSPRQGYNVMHAIVWKKGRGIDIDPNGDCACERYVSNLLAVNDGGTAVGYTLTEDYETAKTWTEATGFKSLRSLEAGQPHYDRAKDINEAGEIVGRGWNSLGLRRALAWLDDNPRELGLVEGYAFSEANGINRHSDIVGTSYDGSAGDYNNRMTATMWRSGAIVDLNSLLDKETQAQWQLKTAQKINDRGEIIGVAQRIGTRKFYAYLMQPK